MLSSVATAQTYKVQAAVNTLSLYKQELPAAAECVDGGISMKSSPKGRHIIEIITIGRGPQKEAE